MLLLRAGESMRKRVSKEYNERVREIVIEGERMRKRERAKYTEKE